MKSEGSNSLFFGLVLALALLAGCNGNSQGAAAFAASSSRSAVLAQSTSSSSASSSAAATSSAGTVPTAAASTATLSWMPPTTYTNGTAITDLAGYRIYYGTDANQLNQVIDISNVGVTSYVLQDLSPGTWYFAVRAYTTSGAESALSNVASKTIA